MAFLVKLRQSNKCGSVRNDEIINLHLGSGAGPYETMNRCQPIRRDFLCNHVFYLTSALTKFSILAKLIPLKSFET